MAWAVIYVRPDRHEARRKAECEAEAVEAGFGVRLTTTNMDEARELYDQGCWLIAAPEHVPDVLDRVMPARRAHRLRPRLALVPLPIGALLEWIASRPARATATAAGSMAAGATALLLLVPDQQYLPPTLEPTPPAPIVKPSSPASERPPAPTPEPASAPAAGNPEPSHREATMQPAPEAPPSLLEVEASVTPGPLELEASADPGLPNELPPALPPGLPVSPEVCVDVGALDLGMLELCLPPQPNG